jgi:hypothetical protein
MYAVMSLNTAKAQSGHVKLWNIFDNCLDFTDGQLKISEIKDELKNAIWYVDANSTIQLYCKKGLFDIDNNKISDDNVDFFIPTPGNENLIYCFSEKGYYYVVNLKTKKIEKSEKKIIQYKKRLAVHHANCTDIWIYLITDLSIQKYLLTSEGLIDKGEIQIFEDYRDIQINLSKDCNFFSAVNIFTKQIYFGKFDRTIGEFNTTSEYVDFPNKYIYFFHSIISPNMTKIYVSGRYNGSRKVLLEIPIENGIPIYKAAKEIKVYPKQGNAYPILFYYGPDNNVYTYTLTKQNDIQTYHFGVIKTDSNGEIVVEDELITNTLVGDTPNLNHIATWLSDNPCDTPPCSQMLKPLIIIKNKD